MNKIPDNCLINIINYISSENKNNYFHNIHYFIYNLINLSIINKNFKKITDELYLKAKKKHNIKSRNNFLCNEKIHIYQLLNIYCLKREEFKDLRTAFDFFYLNSMYYKVDVINLCEKKFKGYINYKKFLIYKKNERLKYEQSKILKLLSKKKNDSSYD